MNPELSLNSPALYTLHCTGKKPARV
ncbi:unnamed protein product [Acanthoscelides obtectus]|uniref:Uncharacterized protein n=1 Tax=Acanthoscelides obtectus TaxID=200917 RepID=A0A9P0Q2K7_ACAOB|nr:unnamed protein product [Acanthoscelides obtectus]CAK1670582.1 hypothetical protein AOBTE_LOCUS27691 [Acanthoscelides obtectus]